MEWNTLTNCNDLARLKEESKTKPVIIFKHSTRCAISSMVVNRLEREWQSEEMDNIVPYFLDLISYRDISNEIANLFNVRHQSPQIIIVRDGIAVFSTSHMEINYRDLKEITQTGMSPSV